jgi:16S rRNA C967 or C1407 C5-methylase (RsmB/RsmF family)
MAGIQWQMITRCADGVKAKGSLTYSTCSVTVEENEMIIERFLKHYPEFHLVDVNPKLGLPGLRGLVSCRRLYPNLHESNGFFVAKLARI